MAAECSGKSRDVTRRTALTADVRCHGWPDANMNRVHDKHPGNVAIPLLTCRVLTVPGATGINTSPVVYLHVTALQSNVTVCARSAAGVRP